MKLLWKPIASACLVLAGTMPAWAQQNQAHTIAEITILTKTVDDKGISTEKEIVLTGDDALRYIKENSKGNEGVLLHSITVLTGEEAKAGEVKDIDIRINKEISEAKVQTPQNYRPALGVTLLQNENNITAVIEEVIEGSAAQEAGLQKGDKIVKINEKTIGSIESLQMAIRALKAGDVVKVGYERNGKSAETTATLKPSIGGHMTNYHWNWKEDSFHPEITPEQACEKLNMLRQDPLLGVYINDKDYSSPGALVTSTLEETGAQKAKMQANDRIIKINAIEVANYTELRTAIQSHEVGEKVRVSFVREGKTLTLPIVLSSVTARDPYQEKILEQLCAKCQTQAAPQPEPEQTSDVPQSDDQQRPSALTGNNATLDIFPNPAQDIVNVSFKGLEQAPIRVALSQLDGKELLTEEISEFNGVYQNQLDLSKLPAGAYIITVSQGKTVLSKQVVLQR